MKRQLTWKFETRPIAKGFDGLFGRARLEVRATRYDLRGKNEAALADAQRPIKAFLTRQGVEHSKVLA